MITDEQIADVLMVGYGYHREWDPMRECSRWVEGFLPGGPRNPANEEPAQDDFEGL